MEDINNNNMDLNQEKNMDYMMDNNIQENDINNENEINDDFDIKLPGSEESNEEFNANESDNNSNFENMMLQYNTVVVMVLLHLKLHFWNFLLLMRYIKY